MIQCTDYDAQQMGDFCRGIHGLKLGSPSLQTVQWTMHHIGDLYTDAPAVDGLNCIHIEGNTPSIFDNLNCGFA